MAEGEALTGVMRQVEHPDCCPTCGVAVTGGEFRALPGYDEANPQQVSPGMVLQPCGHEHH